MRAAKSLGKVQVVLGWGVGYQDVSVGWNGVLPWVLGGRVSKCVLGVREWRLWRSVDSESTVVSGQMEFVRRVLKVFERLPIQRFVLLVHETQGGATTGVEVGVVVSCYDVLMRVRQGGVVVDSGLEFCRSTMVGYVAGVYQNVAIWDVARVERVGVRYADYPDGLRVLRTWAAKGEEEGCQAEQEVEWLTQDRVHEAWAIEERQLWRGCIQIKFLGIHYCWCRSRQMSHRRPSTINIERFCLAVLFTHVE